MSKIIPSIYKKGLIALAVASVSACAVMPQSSNNDHSDGIGDNIVKAGQSVADVSLSAWYKTTRFLGFRKTDDALGNNSRSDSELLAQQNLDRTNQDGSVILQPTDNVEQPLIINQAQAPVAQLSLNESAAGSITQPPADTGESTLAIANAEISGSDGSESVLDETQLANTQSAQLDSESQALFALDQPLNSPTEQGEDLIHEVGDSETLWEIAKRTTGDANNWHTLADINDLTQSATVFPGQELIIPATMVKTGYGAASDTAPSLDTAVTQVIDSEAPEDLVGTTTELAEGADRALEIASALPEASALPALGDTTQTLTIADNATPVDLNEGETLWDFAKRTTGDATNWKAIAAQNNFTEKQAVTVRPGQTIYVPHNLIKSDGISSAALENVQEPVSESTRPVVENVQTLSSSDHQFANAQVEVTSKDITLATADTVNKTTANVALSTDNAEAGTATEIVLTTSETLEDVSLAASDLSKSQTSQMIKTAYKSNDAITSSGATESEALPIVAENENIPAAVMVSGTYYPKAVYNSADFSSSLLMRVSPGTKLQVSRLMGNWFEVETDKGMGYVHQRDIQ